MIHPYNDANLLLWDRGELKVQILSPTSTRPIAYCDGTEEDEQELHQIAESEGTELSAIHRKVLKTGREIWTIGDAPTASDEDDVWSYD